MRKQKSGWLRFLAVALCLGFLAVPAQAKNHKHKPPMPKSSSFDYYLITLSWSPEHCAEPEGSGDTTQCSSSRKFGFVLHGLWPQFEKGHPEKCSTATLDQAVRDSMLDIMPSKKLVDHEWTTHGTCSGLTPAAYFAKARDAFVSVKIPPLYQGPTSEITTNGAEIEKLFGTSNPGLDPDEIALQCQGKFLKEIRVCVDKDLHPRACSSDVKDKCGATIKVRPTK